MTCRDIERHLAAYLAEEIAPGLRRSVKAHLKRCKKCQARFEALTAEQRAREKKEESAIPSADAAPPPESLPLPEEKPLASPAEGISMSGWRRPIQVAVMVLLIGGTLYFYNREVSGLKADFSTAENPTQPVVETPAPAAAVETGRVSQREGTLPPPPVQAASLPPPGRLPMKVHQAPTSRISNAARRQATHARLPIIKLLLVSRNIKEAADTVAAQAVESAGKVLRKKGDEMEGSVVLLIPAERYPTFSESLQSLGLIKSLSKRPPPAQGSLKVEVTIE